MTNECYMPYERANESYIMCRPIEIPLNKLLIRRSDGRYIALQGTTRGASARLLESIKEQGVVQPITVTELSDAFVITSGVQRAICAWKAGFESVPAFIVSEQVPMENDTMSKRNVCDHIELLQEFELYGCKFTEEGKTYQYKAPVGSNYQVGDKVLVHVESREPGFRVVVITDVNMEPEIDKGFKYKWIVGNIDLKRWETLKKQEQEAEEVYRRAKKKKARQEALDAIKESVGPENFKLLEATNVEATNVDTTNIDPGPSQSDN